MDENPLDLAMDRYARGDDRAFVPLYEGLAPRLRAFLLRLSGSEALADDLAQETFVRMHRARGTFEPAAPVVPWAYAIARNVWLDHARSAKLRRTAPLATEGRESDPGVDPPAGPEADGEQAAIARETAAVVERVLASLPAAQREAFVLLRYEGLSVEDASAVLGTTRSAVKLRAFRAYEALRAALGRGKGSSDGRRDDAA